MDLGWKRLIPLALAMLMIVAGFQINTGQGSLWQRDKWGVAAILGSVALGLLLWRAITVGQRASSVESARDERVSREVGR
jgi:protein-S-isoprenylcysteine O-methyltransferase Ste14